MTGTWPPILAIADDLSGAAECAAVLLRSGIVAPVALDSVATWRPERDEPIEDVVLDADLRRLPPREHADRLRAELSHASARNAQVVIKIDSALRGRVSTALSVAAERGPVLVATALPSIGRTSVGGRVLVDGSPLADVTAHGEDAAVASVLDAVPPGVQHRHIDLEMIRGEHLTHVLAEVLADATAVVTCDGEHDADLDRVVAALPNESSPGVGVTTLIGSAGLVAALARRRSLPMPVARPVPDHPTQARLVLVGSRAAAARAQVAAVEAVGARVVMLRADAGNVEAVVADVAAHLPQQSVIVSVGDDVGDPSAIVRALACVAASAPSSVPLVTVGGQTARAVADALGFTSLRVRGEIGYGMTVCESDTGRTMVIRPGSFGEEGSLIPIAIDPRPRAGALN